MSTTDREGPPRAPKWPRPLLSVVRALLRQGSVNSAVARTDALMERLERHAPGRWRTLLGRLRSLLGRGLALGLRSQPQGYVDGWADGIIRGWAWIPDRPERRLTVQVIAADSPVTTVMADQLREDVMEAGLGDGHYGFLAHVEQSQVARMVGPAVVQVVVGVSGAGGSIVPIGTMPLTENLRPESLLDRLPADFVSRSITPWAVAMMNLPAQDGVQEDGDVRDGERPPAYRRLFENNMRSPQLQSNDTFQPRPTLSPYIRYTAQRSGKDADYPLDRSPEATDGLLHWYLDAYSRHRAEYRAPLSPSELAYLNAPVNPIVKSDQRRVSRISLSQYLEADDLAVTRMSPVDPDDHLEFVYWWSVERAPALHLEDCLVPDYYLDVLRAPGRVERIDGVPLSAFLELYVERYEGMQGVDLMAVDGVRGAYLHVLLRSAQQPHLLRYIPKDVQDWFLRYDDEDVCLLDTLVEAAIGRARVRPGDVGGSAVPQRPRDQLLDCIDAAGFDLDLGVFRSQDRDGFRVHAAQSRAPVGRSPVSDVQVIGPFAKISGLGQACRMAGDILDATRFSVNRVDFGLDNPSPAGHGSDAHVAELRSARVNLLHLNAESVPLAFAYLPDVFTDSYNIGFFYWELDKPATCHELALELLDEIWVASEYGVSTYRPYSRIPVTNVGTAFEELPDINREESRALLSQRCGVREDTFVFLATFDSFSYATRKNPVGTLRAFQAAFSDRGDDVMLILKMQNRHRRGVMASTQTAELDALFELAAGDPRVAVIDETLDYRSLLHLKKGCDAYVSLHRAEGWGFGPLEAMALGVPVICTAYSGNMDYCRDDNAWLVDYDLVNVAEKDYLFVLPGHRWAEPSPTHAAAQMRQCREDSGTRRSKAKAAHDFVTTNFSVETVARRYERRLDEIVGSAGA